MTERTNITIPDEDKLLVKSLGFKNFSEFVRLCMDGALSVEDEVCPHCGQLMDKKKSEAVKIGISIRNERLKNQTKLPEIIPEPEEKKIRCWDKGQESYAMITASEIAKNPDWYTVDETIAPYEVQS